MNHLTKAGVYVENKLFSTYTPAFVSAFINRDLPAFV